MKPVDLRAWWDHRPLREKLLVAVVAVAAPVALADALLTAPLARRLERAGAQLAGLREQLQSRQAQDREKHAALAAQQQQQARLQERLRAAEDRLAAIDRRIAEGARLPEMLRSLAATVGPARVIALDLGGVAEPLAPLGAASGAAAGAPLANAAAERARRLYRLPITLRVSAGWPELHELLVQIERHADSLEWTSLKFDNSQWPSIELTLSAHVLSREPRWGAST